MDFKLQLGAKLSHPQELTFVSDWGEIVQVTTLQLERRRVYLGYTSPAAYKLTPVKARASFLLAVI
jgi:hypothetical protein